MNERLGGIPWGRATELVLRGGRPHGRGPPLEAASNERERRPGGPMTPRIITNRKHNTLSIPVTVSRIHSHSKTGKLNVINNNPRPGEQ